MDATTPGGNPVVPTHARTAPVDPTPTGVASADVRPVDPTPADPTPADPTPADPTPADPGRVGWAVGVDVGGTKVLAALLATTARSSPRTGCRPCPDPTGWSPPCGPASRCSPRGGGLAVARR